MAGCLSEQNLIAGESRAENPLNPESLPPLVVVETGGTQRLIDIHHGRQLSQGCRIQQVHQMGILQIQQFEPDSMPQLEPVRAGQCRPEQGVARRLPRIGAIDDTGNLQEGCQHGGGITAQIDGRQLAPGKFLVQVGVKSSPIHRETGRLRHHRKVEVLAVVAESIPPQNQDRRSFSLFR